MSEEEKLQWKNQVFQDCKDMDDRIDNNLKLIQEERDLIKETILNTSRMLSNYQDEVDRIGKKAMELQLPEIERKEESIKNSVGPVLTTQVRAALRKRGPQIQTTNIDHNMERLPKHRSDIKPKQHSSQYLLNLSELQVKPSSLSETSSQNSLQTAGSSSSRQNVVPQLGSFFKGPRKGSIDSSTIQPQPEVFNRLYGKLNVRTCDTCQVEHTGIRRPCKATLEPLQLTSLNRSLLSVTASGGKRNLSTTKNN